MMGYGKRQEVLRKHIQVLKRKKVNGKKGKYGHEMSGI